MGSSDSFSYYTGKLAAERLQRCYELAPPAVQRYLQAEIEHLRQRLTPGDRVLELGCGYGRVLRELAPSVALAVGIDTSLASLAMAVSSQVGLDNLQLGCMDAMAPAFPAASFDLVCCVQNGISAFHVDQRLLLATAVRVTRPGGRVLFSSYAEQFWDDRLAWFRIQAEHGLVGEIDEAATGNGVIVCRDGFSATTVDPEQWHELADGLGSSISITEVAGSSLYCEIVV